LALLLFSSASLATFLAALPALDAAVTTWFGPGVQV
jgi:hypothetical protein